MERETRFDTAPVLCGGQLLAFRLTVQEAQALVQEILAGIEASLAAEVAVNRTVELVRACGHTETFIDDLPLHVWERIKERLAREPCLDCRRKAPPLPDAGGIVTREKEP